MRRREDTELALPRSCGESVVGQAAKEEEQLAMTGKSELALTGMSDFTTQACSDGDGLQTTVELQSTVDQVSVGLVHLTARMDAVSASVSELSKPIRDLQIKVGHTSDQLAHLHSRIEALEGLPEGMRQFQDQVVAVDDGNRATLNKVFDLQQDLACTKTSLAHLRSGLGDAESAISKELRPGGQDAREELTRMGAAQRAATDVVEALKKSVEESRKEFQRFHLNYERTRRLDSKCFDEFRETMKRLEQDCHNNSSIAERQGDHIRATRGLYMPLKEKVNVTVRSQVVQGHEQREAMTHLSQTKDQVGRLKEQVKSLGENTGVQDEGMKEGTLASVVKGLLRQADRNSDDIRRLVGTVDGQQEKQEASNGASSRASPSPPAACTPFAKASQQPGSTVLPGLTKTVPLQQGNRTPRFSVPE